MSFRRRIFYSCCSALVVLRLRLRTPLKSNVRDYPKHKPVRSLQMRRHFIIIQNSKNKNTQQQQQQRQTLNNGNDYYFRRSRWRPQERPHVNRHRLDSHQLRRRFDFPPESVEQVLRNTTRELHTGPLDATVVLRQTWVRVHITLDSLVVEQRKI